MTAPASASGPAASTAAAPSAAAPVPADKEQVQDAVRLGWAMAEVRGRNRPGGPSGQTASLPHPLGDDPRPLPLSVERTPTELRVQAQVAVQVLASRLGVDAHPAHGSFGRAIDAAAHILWQVRRAEPADPDREEAAWAHLADLLWELDDHVQDRLSAGSATRAAGYQLGRALAECYWALALSEAEGWGTWGFLFSDRRCNEITRLAGRLASYMQDLSAAAITGSLETWKLLARDEQWRAVPKVGEALYTQIRNWYGLAVLDEDPTRSIRPYDLLRNWRVVLEAARGFWAQLTLAAVGVGALFGFVYVVSGKHPAPELEFLFSILSTFGLSAAGLTTKLKNEAQSLTTRLRQDAYTDLVAVSITTVPDPPHRDHGRSRRAVVEKTVRKRSLTPATPLQ